MRPRQLLASVVSASFAFAAVAACVGDDPAPSGPGAADDASAVEASSTDAPADAAAQTDGAAPTDAGSDATAPYDVRSLPGLRLWLESTKDLAPESVGSSGFGSWGDSSGHWADGGAGAPDGGRHVALPYNVNPPSIVANAFGGRPTISFIDGNGYLQIANHEDFLFGLGDFFIAVVAKVASGMGPLWLLTPQATAGTKTDLTPGSFCVAYGLGVNNGCTTPPYTASTEPHVFVGRRKSDIFTLRVDGSVRSTLDRSASPPSINVRTFQGPRAVIGGGTTMQVSEVIVVVGSTSDPALADLEGQLKTKYAIP